MPDEVEGVPPVPERDTVNAQAEVIVKLHADLVRAEGRVRELGTTVRAYKLERVDMLMDLATANSRAQMLDELLNQEARGEGVEILEGSHEASRRALLAERAGYAVSLDHETGRWTIDWTQHRGIPEDPLANTSLAERTLIVQALHDRVDRRLAQGADATRSRLLAERIESHMGVARQD